MSKKIVFTTGGTGGHIFPALHLMEHFFNNGYEVLIVTDYRASKFLKNNFKFRYKILKTETLTNKNILHKFFSIFVIIYSIINAMIILNKEKPDLVFGFGGYVSFPISLASKLFKVPLVIYENNAVLGKANKILAHFSKKILTSNNINKNLPIKFRDKTYEVGPLLSKKIINKKKFEKNNNLSNFSIIVLGGSQGAEIFGKVVPEVIKMVKDQVQNIEIRQQCISSQKKSIIEFYEKNNIKNYVFDFEENVLDLILSSNIAITRSGASSTAELIHTLTPFVAIPLPNSVDNHQYLNAKYYKDKGCCWIIEERDFNVSNLYNFVIETIKNKNKLENVRNNMKSLSKNNVYIDIEKEIKEFVKL
jgi:UDP-N-acetylglucosamine--N-acetylmuramyl-(pentapeptide) pyrophosphoryl-undecaprenol N-acetylglucosamine transferase